MDWEFPKKDLIARPQLYAKGLKENYLDWSKYFWALFEAILHGFVIFVTGFMYFDSALT